MAHLCPHGTVCFCNSDLDEQVDETPEWCTCDCEEEDFDDEDDDLFDEDWED